MDTRTPLPSPPHPWARRPRALATGLAARVEALAFWGAIALPPGYLALLASGIEGGSGFGLFLGLVAAHVVALVVGHDHRGRTPEPSTEGR